MMMKRMTGKIERVFYMEVLKMYIRTICVLVEDENGNGFYWGSEYGYKQIIKEAESK